MPYTPKDANNLAIYKDVPQQIRLLLQGYGGTGKTWVSTTFPNAVFLNLDRGLGAHSGREDLLEIPLLRADICKKYSPNGFIKEAIEAWMQREGSKLEEDQTLIIDHLTSWQNHYHKWYKGNRVYSSKSGKEDERAEWRLKQEYFAEVTEAFKTLRCNVILLTHEVEARFKKGPEAGELTGKLRPLLTGQFGDEITGHFTDVFRCHVAPKPSDYSKITPETLAKWHFTKVEQFKEMCDSFVGHAFFYWQLQGDDMFDAKASSLVNFPLYAKADYSTFARFKRDNVQLANKK